MNSQPLLFDFGHSGPFIVHVQCDDFRFVYIKVIDDYFDKLFQVINFFRLFRFVLYFLLRNH